MTLDKAIEHGKEHRKQYRGSKVFDRTCRNHGGNIKHMRFNTSNHRNNGSFDHVCESSL